MSCDIIVPLDDPDVESDETVSLALSGDAAYTVGSPSSGTVTITSNDVGGNLPVVTITRLRNAAEAGGRGRVRIDRSGDLSTALTVRYAVGGPATAGADYMALDGEKTLKAGSSRAWFDIKPLDDSETEGDESVLLNLSAAATYQVGAAGSATVTIADNDRAGLQAAATR